MWPRGIAELARGAVHLFYPGRCFLCDRMLPDDNAGLHSVCTECTFASTHDSSKTCPHCAATVGPHTHTLNGCYTCRGAGFRFDAAIRLGPYEGLLRDAILRAKKSGGEAVAEALGTIYADVRSSELLACGADVVVPIPLHWRHRFIRGHNQAEEIARAVAVKLKLPCKTNWLRRVKPVVQHSQPSALARRESIKGAFSIASRARLAERTVLLVDDVMTTGSTLSEAAGVLKQAGAKCVMAGVIARR